MRSLRSIVAVLAALAAGLIWAASAQAAGWAVQSPLQPQIPSGWVTSISCATATNCVSVGWLVNESRLDVPLAEQWDGSRWENAPPVSPSAGGELAGVSCPSADACIAVGYAGTNTLAEQWDGSTWSVMSTPNANAYNSLATISCASQDDCFAVGYSMSSGGPYPEQLIEHWDGESWTIQSPSTPSNATATQLEGISCSSSSACTAVGYYDTDGLGGEQPLVERWDGSQWTSQSFPNAPGDSFDAISCDSAVDCSAVGSEVTDGEGNAIAAHWDGTTWSFEALASPNGATSTTLNDINCTLPTDCTAVGSAQFSATSSGMLAEHWNGVSWTAEDVPDIAGAELEGVECLSATNCLAAGGAWPTENGFSAAETVSLIDSGGTWSVQPSPGTINAYNSFGGVSCAGPDDCMAVGSELDADNLSHAMVEHWDGSAWSFRAPPSVPGETSAQLDSISCTGSSCMAVGSVQVNGSTYTHTMAAEWDGTNWSLTTTASPNPSYDELLGVSCPSSSQCVAVGDIYDYALAELWNGSNWVVETLPALPAGAFNQLDSVSCAGVDDCVAVGDVESGEGGQDQPLVEHWNGVSWSVVSVPLPADGSSGEFDSVSCPSSDVCFAVGSYSDGGTDYPLVEESQDGIWEPQNLQGMPRQTASLAQLNAVSCSSPDSCVTAGNESGYGSWQTISAYWNGSSWGEQDTPDLANMNGLSGLSCSSSTSCLGVGWQDTGTGVYHQSLAESFAGPAPSVNTSPPVIMGEYGYYDEVAHGTWTNDPTGYSYQWERCDSSGGDCSVIPYFDGSAYIAYPADIGHTLRLEEFATNVAGLSAPAASAPTAVITKSPYSMYGPQGSGSSPTNPSTTTKPSLTLKGLRMHPLRFFAGAASVGAKKVLARRYGTTISFVLNHPARVVFRVEKAKKGRRVRHGTTWRCVRATKDHHPACRRLVALPGKLTRTAAAGHDSFHFSGRLSGQLLGPGKYVLVATPSAGSNIGSSASLPFTVRSP